MTGWWGAFPALLSACVLLLAPGAVVGLALGLRGTLVAGLAPLLSAALIATGAVAAALVGLRWSAPAAILATTAGAAAAALLGRVLCARSVAARADRSREPRMALLGAILGCVAGALLISLPAAHGIGRPDAVSQTRDAMFHLNAITRSLQTGDASSLHVGTLQTPMRDLAFYPSAFHGFAVLVAQAAHVDVPTAANTTALAVAGVAWPLGCIALVRQLLGPRPLVLVLAGVLSAALSSFPFLLLGYGVLWPNLLGIALLPALLAALTSLLGLAADDVLGRRRAAIVLAAGIVAAVLAHPNAVVSFLLFGGLMVLEQRAPAAVALVRRGQPLRVAAGLLGAAAVVTLAWEVVHRSPSVRHLASFHWPLHAPARHSAAVALLNGSTPHAAWGMGALAVLGAAVLLARRRHLWIVGGWLLSAGLYVLAASVNAPWKFDFTGFWYNDALRVLAVIPVLAIVLTLVGVDWIVGRLRRMRWSPARTALVTALVGAVIVAAAASSWHDGAPAVARGYDPSRARGGFLAPRQEELFVTLRYVLPWRSVTANDPWDGSAFLWTLSGRRVLFPVVNGTWDPDRRLLARRLHRIGTDRAVCAAARRLRVGFVISGPATAGARTFPGVDGVRAGPAFRVIARRGGAALYRITRCAGAPAPGARHHWRG